MRAFALVALLCIAGALAQTTSTISIDLNGATTKWLALQSTTQSVAISNSDTVFGSGVIGFSTSANTTFPNSETSVSTFVPVIAPTGGVSIACPKYIATNRYLYIKPTGSGSAQNAVFTIIESPLSIPTLNNSQTAVYTFSAPYSHQISSHIYVSVPDTTSTVRVFAYFKQAGVKDTAFTVASANKPSTAGCPASFGADATSGSNNYVALSGAAGNWLVNIQFGSAMMVNTAATEITVGTCTGASCMVANPYVTSSASSVLFSGAVLVLSVLVALLF
eukprot:TRINITY_DN4192_c0_g1_i1.p1 TRINITY_DN4192_c0_g1~~TRINITY_DN4192_c0_g1_i1.p1  ORF type:complete len:302 (+),score=132.96 TRINITY_DN4192_c0_g1_i1:78-908(+)